ncbi:MAG TPA: molybdopterin-dependent oxidoreductase [Bryobacteraceae bacterium]|nr:molybdopterin-dependent oxidoreductase [Bryobacteraceae bacterium]
MNPMRRREMIALAAMAPSFARFAMAEEGEQTIPFLDSRPYNPEKPTLKWDELTSWMTPRDQRFRVGHYGFPTVDVASWNLQIGGLVERPLKLTLEDLRKRKAKELSITMECSGNPANGGMVYNTKWKGTPLGPVLREAGLKPEGIEVVFYAADSGTEKIRGADYPQNFARSLAVKDAIKDNVLLCWEMDGAPLESHHGAPLRLVVPGWYGVAWVKWLTRIEVQDRAFLSRFMGRDYVTIRGEKQGEKVIWRETSVGRMNLKSIAARVTKRKDGTLRVVGAAWSDGTPIQKVELKIDDGQWMPVQISKDHQAANSWVFWSYEWKNANPGEHTITSRATDARGHVQPAPDDAFIALKKTYWEANQQAVRKIKV